AFVDPDAQRALEGVAGLAVVDVLERPAPEGRTSLRSSLVAGKNLSSELVVVGRARIVASELADAANDPAAGRIGRAGGGLAGPLPDRGSGRRRDGANREGKDSPRQDKPPDASSSRRVNLHGRPSLGRPSPRS